jgi:hypothetical protein
MMKKAVVFALVAAAAVAGAASRGVLVEHFGWTG